MFKATTQKYYLGCAIACFASINKISYEKAKKFFSKFGDANKNGYFCRDIIKIFDKLGKKYSYKYIKRKKRRFYSFVCIFKQ
jgi:hypothetical protein